MDNKTTTLGLNEITQIYKELSELNDFIDMERFTDDENFQIFQSFQRIEGYLVTLQHCMCILSKYEDYVLNE